MSRVHADENKAPKSYFLDEFIINCCRYIRGQNVAFGGIFHVFLVFLILVGLPACNPLNQLGDIINGLEEKVSRVLDQANSEGQVLTANAANQVGLALTNVEFAFAEDLDKSIDDVDEAAQRAVNRLEVLTNSLESTAATTLNDTIDGSQQIVNSLPFTNRNPQVRDYSPKVLTGREGKYVNLSVSGNFYWAMDEGKEVQLKVDNESFSATEITTARVGFLVPVEVLRSSSSDLSSVSMEFIAPYETGKIFSKNSVGVFRLLLTALPKTPFQSLTITNSVAVKGETVISRMQPSDRSTWMLRAENCKPKEQSHTVMANLNHTIIQESIKTGSYLKHPSGPYDFRTPEIDPVTITAQGPFSFVVKAEAKPKCTYFPLGGSLAEDASPLLKYYVSYDESLPTEHRRGEVVDLLKTPDDASAAEERVEFGWGGSISTPVEKGHWTVKAVLWDGRVIQASESDNSSQILHILDEGHFVRVTLVSPASVFDLQ